MSPSSGEMAKRPASDSKAVYYRDTKPSSRRRTHSAAYYRRKIVALATRMAARHGQRPVFATVNDKISVQYNEFLQKLENKEIYSDENDAYEIRIGSGANDVLRLRRHGGYSPK